MAPGQAGWRYGVRGFAALRIGLHAACVAPILRPAKGGRAVYRMIPTACVPGSSRIKDEDILSFKVRARAPVGVVARLKMRS